MTKRQKQSRCSTTSRAHDGRLVQGLRDSALSGQLRVALIAWALCTSALAQTQHPPQPTARPRDIPQTPIPPAPTIAPTPVVQAPVAPLQTLQAPQTRQEWRSIRRSCGEEWSRMMKTGQTTGLIWTEFFKACGKRS